MSASGRVLVIGGGLAGIAAALDCADAGAEVTLLEVRPQLGGAAYSYEREGMVIDNGQHVFLRCCVAYVALLERLGSGRHTHIQPRLRIPVLSPGAAATELRRRSLPAPLHLAGALARYRHLSVPQRLSAARAALALRRLDPGDDALDRITFGDWLERHGQDARTVANLWDLVALPTLNVPAARASLALAAFVFRTGLLGRADAGDIGFHRGTLSGAIGDPAAAALRRAGVEVRLGTRVERLHRTDAGLLVGADSVMLEARAVIVAVPHARAATLLEQLLPDRARAIAALGSSPIVNLHVVYDRQVCSEPFAAGVGTPVQYVFDRTAAAGAPQGSQYLAVSLSGAEREMTMSVDQLRARYLPALEQLLPRARAAKVERFFASREHAATFLAAPGSRALRPGPQTELPGLALAGAWTDTGWPATLEGAVKSGHAAAAVALRALASRPGGAGPRAGARAGAEGAPARAGAGMP